MVRLLIVAVCLLLAGLTPAATFAAGPKNKEIRSAVERSIPYLEAAGAAWIEKRKCASCHQVPFMLWSLNEAASAGFELDRAKLDETSQWAITSGWDRQGETPAELLESTSKSVDVIYQLLLGRNRAAKLTDKEWVGTYRSYLIETQQDDGSWKAARPASFAEAPAARNNRSFHSLGADGAFGI